MINRENEMENILNKVKKLLALANDSGASEGERDNALRMAHGLLAKHNLDMLDLTRHMQVEGREDYMGAGFSMMWCKYISQSIAKLFFCKYYFGAKINGTKVEHHFVGKSSNATTAALMSEYVIASILSQCRKNWKHNLAPESRAFATGASDKIRTRVAEMIATAKPEGSESTSLVLVEFYKTEMEANEQYLKSQSVSLVKGKHRQQASVNETAYASGKQFGGTIGLNGQVVQRDQIRIS